MSFTKRTNAPFRLDVVGSFLRPEAIKEARTAFAAGTITADELKAVEDRCITELVENELAAGLQWRHRRGVPPQLLAPGFHVGV